MNRKNFKKLISKTPSKWKEKAQVRVSQPWLTEYSSQIARRIVALIKDDKDLNQTRLGKEIGVERQYISRVIQGKENLSLQTIWKLSKALGFELINFPEYEYSKSRNTVRSRVPKDEVKYSQQVKKTGETEKKVSNTDTTKIVPMKLKLVS